MRRVGEFLAEFSRRYTPDSFVFAILLTLLIYVLALFLTPHGPFQLIQDWYQGFWNLLTFSMQMVLILVTGYALASSPIIERCMTYLASKPTSGAQSVALVALVAGLLGWVSWGLSLIAGALLARKAAISGRLRGIKIHFPLVAAAGYTGQLIWHGGLSGQRHSWSIPLATSLRREWDSFSVGDNLPALQPHCVPKHPGVGAPGSDEYASQGGASGGGQVA